MIIVVVVVAAEFVFIVITCGSKIEYVRLLYARSEDHTYIRKSLVVNFIPKITQQQQQRQR